MKRLSVLLIAVFASVASAQDLITYNKALSAFNAGDYDKSAQLFFEAEQTVVDAEVRAKAEYYRAASLAKKGLPFLAGISYASMVKTGKAHPMYLKAVEGVVNMQETLDERDLFPSLLNTQYNDDWATLPTETLARINYLIGAIAQRKAKFEESRSFLEAVPKDAAVHAKAQYLLGIVLVDKRYPGGAQFQDAIKAFESVINNELRNQKDLVQTQQLAMLGLGRTYYNMGEYAKSVDWYEKVPRFSRYWDTALFENGFARYQNGDSGGALGSLQALHAPQFTGAFQPESWYLKSVIYFEKCLFEEAKTALQAFDDIYLPLGESLKPLSEAANKDLEEYFKMVSSAETSKLPKPVLNWVRSNERMLDVFRTLKELETERAVVESQQGWKAAKLAPELIALLDSNRDVLTKVAGQLAKSRLGEASRTVKYFTDQGEIVRFETSKAEKELAEQGVDQRAVLRKLKLYRPRMPAENWNYWKFQGEFWRDEIGYYQYTLRDGCGERPQ